MDRFEIPPCCVCRRIRRLPEKNYFVYVVALADVRSGVVELRPDGTPSTVYVGQSWHTPECRYNQHLIGYKSSASVRERGRELVPSLFASRNPIRGRWRAEEMEHELAGELRSLGFAVVSN